MQRKALVFLILTTVLIGPLAAADLDEIIQRNIEARGGLEKIQSVDTMRATGTMLMMGGQMEAPFVLEWKRPNKSRREFTIQGQVGIQAFDGKTAWMYMPLMGKTAPEVLPEEQAQKAEIEADLIDGPFIGTERKGYELEYLGEGDVDGTPVHKIEATNRNGDSTVYFLDAESFLNIGQEGKQKQGETEIEYEVILGNFQEVEGLMMPHSMEARPKGGASGQMLTIDKFEFGIEIDDERFIMPKIDAPAATESDGGQ